MPRIACVVAFVALLVACSAPERNPLARWVPSANHGPREPILIVLHGTEQDSVIDSLATLRSRNSGGRVSAHYLIGRDGAIYQLVEDSRRAWHAGAGSWGTITDVNSASLGIELDNDGSAAFPPAQLDALVRLLDDLCDRHGIPRTQVIGHADMAPARKRDPNALFPWRDLARAGFGRWPREPLLDPPPGFDAVRALRELGYPTADVGAAIRSFRRHYRGVEQENAVLDAEDARILYSLLPPP